MNPILTQFVHEKGQVVAVIGGVEMRLPTLTKARNAAIKAYGNEIARLIAEIEGE